MNLLPFSQNVSFKGAARQKRLRTTGVHGMKLLIDWALGLFVKELSLTRHSVATELCPPDPIIGLPDLSFTGFRSTRISIVFLLHYTFDFLRLSTVTQVKTRWEFYSKVFRRTRDEVKNETTANMKQKAKVWLSLADRLS